MQFCEFFVFGMMGEVLAKDEFRALLASQLLITILFLLARCT